MATVIAEDSSKSGFELKSVCGKTAVKNVMNTIFGNANDSFDASTMPIDKSNITISGLDEYYLFGFAANITTSTGNVTVGSNSYSAGVPVTSADAISSTGGLDGTASDVEVRYGCASDADGWVVWGKLSGDEVFCVDSRSSTGTTALPYR